MDHQITITRRRFTEHGTVTVAASCLCGWNTADGGGWDYESAFLSEVKHRASNHIYSFIADDLVTVDEAEDIP